MYGVSFQESTRTSTVLSERGQQNSTKLLMSKPASSTDTLSSFSASSRTVDSSYPIEQGTCLFAEGYTDECARHHGAGLHE